MQKDINELCMYLMLFTDDILLFTTDPISLHAQIDNIISIFIKIRIEIKCKKSKICIFEKNITEPWYRILH